MRFQRKTFSCEALRRNLMRGVAFRQLVIKKRRDFQSSPETYALSVHSGLVADEPTETAGSLQPVKLIGSTRNISESGIALVVPSTRVGFRFITEENCILRIVLEIHPKGLVEMEAMTVRSERLKEKENDGYFPTNVTFVS